MTPTLEYHLISEELSPTDIGDKVLGYRNLCSPLLYSARCRRYKWGVLYAKTEKTSVGLGSIDRNNKATLQFTPPSSITKSYAKVLSPRMVKLQDVS